MPEIDDSFVPVADARPGDVPWPPLTWPPQPGVVVTTGRVVELVPADPARDAEALFAALDDERVWQHVKGRPDTAQAYAVTLDRNRAAGALPWLVRLRVPCAGLPAGTVVGTSSYLDVSVPDARLEIGSTAYTPAVWGTAVNPDTKLALLAQAFDVLGAGRVQLKTDVRNVRSQRAIARLGARYEGILRRYQRRADGTVRDTVMFSILAEDWPQVRARIHRTLEPYS
ncbi:GNAT family N-acetyltransferase [Pseudonocardia kunmingensis]|uniref:RimJ/RimL family protein N-acetyltransferase n=1 Tax=Pseudonocardia kunmingensis TaxID=630975 RepID=A0A543E055_9PSEU|nr:GNAT family protein [Pseudonocardia kunmingensis]TQM14973.1 RimJ/RimL family protein N-acetyltransferase [Pseudonocardia kunmingensis]